ncbi:hypothetical protein JCM33374_g76 [Metschnikowia sp. JCM 33374]|nr:hypothetical protein JCM33374_g76 [Metschnikowia sp. JCM 33374]
MPPTHSDPRHRRTEYSKSGCKECKRRKIKCDEFINPPPEAYSKINAQGRQSCWQCTRLKKVCEYPLKGEKVPRVSRRVLLESKSKVSEEDSSPTNAQTIDIVNPPQSAGPNNNHSHHPPHAPQAKPSAKPAISSIHYEATYHPLPSHHQTMAHLYPNSYHIHKISPDFRRPSQIIPNTNMNVEPFVADSSLVNPTRETHLPAVDGGAYISEPTSLSGSIPPSGERSQSFDPADLTLLATDLNNLVSDMIFEVNNDLKDDTVTRPRVPGVNQPHDRGPNISQKNRSSSYNNIPRNVGIGIFDVTDKERIYLQEFYSGFASVILPFNAYDPVNKAYYNPIRDVLFFCAYNESFMLAAILAQGARSVFLQSNLVDDEFAYYKYLSKCLALLGPALGDHMSKVDSVPLPNIEAVLLTVLLLTSSNASNSKQNWRPHLRGAKDILLKYTTSRKDISSSKLILLCKYWFIVIEILAGLSSKLGGTIESDEELDLLFSYSDRNEEQVLSNLGLVANNGFFLVGGYQIDLIPAWKDLIKLLNKRRKSTDYKKDETLEYLRLLAIFERQNNMEFVNKKALLKNSDFPGGCVPPGVLLDVINFNHDHVIISWMDTAQQLYCIAACIFILTDFLDVAHDSPQVQTLVHRLTSFLGFLAHCSEAPPLIKCVFMMIQWPMIIAGINSVREQDQKLVLKYFDLTLKAGAGSAGYSISRMKRIWKNRETGVSEPVDDDFDVVCY